MPHIQKIKTFLASKEPQMLALLEELVLVQSGSHNKKGVDRVADIIAGRMQEMGLATELIEQAILGNHLIVRSPCRPSTAGQVLLVGHMDTVFPHDTEFNGYREDADKCYGPGVSDMKGGLVVGVFASMALQHIGALSEIPLAFIFNSDEEIGSRSSLDIIQQEANNSAFAFVLEGGGADGQIVTGRKGNLKVELHVEGKAGHAAFAGENKPSAILEMAHKIIALEALNDHPNGITINVGKVEGGIGSNTIPDLCTAQIDFRYVDPQSLKLLKKKVSDIANQQQVKGTSSRVDIISGRPPMPAGDGNRGLFQRVRKVAQKLGHPIREEFRHGVSDANFIADMNTPVLDGLGPIGSGEHSNRECLHKATLQQRALLLACAIVECWASEAAG